MELRLFLTMMVAGMIMREWWHLLSAMFLLAGIFCVGVTIWEKRKRYHG